MRLFAAVYPPPGVAESLDAAIGDRDDQLRWVPLHQWHVTLAFYGQVADDVVPDLCTRLQRAAARTPPMTMRLSGAATFPRQQSRARVVHVGLAGELEPLTRLAERCAAAARRVGVAMEERGFRPHLTLGRARHGTLDAREIVGRLSSYQSDPWTVTSFQLVHSTLGAAVAHRPVQEFALTTA